MKYFPAHETDAMIAFRDLHRSFKKRTRNQGVVIEEQDVVSTIGESSPDTDIAPARKPEVLVILNACRRWKLASQPFQRTVERRVVHKNRLERLVGNLLQGN
jgi:hypothetical protein